MSTKRNAIRVRSYRPTGTVRYSEVSGDPSTYIDDDDSRVHYTKHWSSNSTQSTHYTTVTGSQSTLTFNGSYIAVYGVVPDISNHTKPPSASYSIDGSLISTQTQNYSSQGIQLFFVSPQLSPTTEHTLVINITNAASGYFLDYFLVISNSSTLATSTASIEPTLPVHYGLSKSSMVAAIVGTVIGSAVLLLLSFIVWLRFLRKKPLTEPESSPLPTIGVTVASPSYSVHGTVFTTSASILQADIIPGTPHSSQFSYYYEKPALGGNTHSDHSDPPKSPITPTTCSDISTLRFAP